ncbi:MAG: hypothetical protein Q9212_006208 [Teloschistes hypoglaucus]
MAQKKPSNGPPSQGSTGKDLNVGCEPANQNGLQLRLPSYQGWLPASVKSVNAQREQVNEGHHAHFQSTQSSFSPNSSNSSKPAMPASTSNPAIPQGSSTYKGINPHRAQQSRPKTEVPKKSRYTPLTSRSDRNKVTKPEPRRPTNIGQHAQRQLLTTLRHLGLGSSRNAEPLYPDIDDPMDMGPGSGRYSGPSAGTYSSGFDHPTAISQAPLDRVRPRSNRWALNNSTLPDDFMDPTAMDAWLQDSEDLTTATAGPVIDPDLMNMDSDLTSPAPAPNGSVGNTPEPFMDYEVHSHFHHHHPGYTGSTPPPAMYDDMETHIATNAPQMATNHNESTVSTSVDASADANVDSGDQTPETANIGRIAKKKPAPAHLLYRRHAPPLDTRGKKKGPTVEKVRVDNRVLGPQDERAVLEAQIKANQAGILVDRCLQAAAQGGDVPKLLEELREELHTLEHSYVMIEPEILTNSRILEHAFPTIFANPIFTWDIRSDARVLYNRYAQGEADPHLLRGIDTRKPRDEENKRSRTTHTIDKQYPYRANAAIVGAGNLQNGQWWPYQICALRDGAHGARVDGIFGVSGQGALSVVLSGTGYSDVDEGDIIKYCGTSGHADGPTRSTKRMQESRVSGKPVRVLRSHKIKAAHSIYRPKVGLRYDGLYRVTDSELLVQETSMWRFTLVRCEGQTPIRYQGVEARPNKEDLEAFSRH